MTKQEKIKQAWGGSYGPEVDENGWQPLRFAFIPSTLKVDISQCGEKYRPKSLHGIENNNGWITITDYNRDSITLDCLVYTDKGRTHFFTEYERKPSIYLSEVITHAQPIIKPEPPVY